MNEATMTEPATANPASAGIRTGSDAPETGSAPVNGIPTGESPMGGTPVNGAPTGESAAPSGLYAVKMTAEEMDAQRKLWVEYVHAITRDEKRADELQRKIIFPSFILKSTKRLMGADYIRKEGYNTVDADLVYGPGWLDEDDGGPLSMFAEGYKGRVKP